MNANTGEASWTNPLQLSGSSEALDGSQQSLDDVRSQWVSYIDENTGNEYWYNTLTGETSKYMGVSGRERAEGARVSVCRGFVTPVLMQLQGLTRTIVGWIW